MSKKQGTLQQDILKQRGIYSQEDMVGDRIRENPYDGNTFTTTTISRSKPSSKYEGYGADKGHEWGIHLEFAKAIDPQTGKPYQDNVAEPNPLLKEQKLDRLKRYNAAYESINKIPAIDKNNDLAYDRPKYQGNYNYIERYLQDNDDGISTPEQLLEKYSQQNPEWFNAKNSASKRADLDQIADPDTDNPRTKLDLLFDRQMQRREITKMFGRLPSTNYTRAERIAAAKQAKEEQDNSFFGNIFSNKPNKIKTTPDEHVIDNTAADQHMNEMGFKLIKDSYTIDKDGLMTIDNLKLQESINQFKQIGYKAFESRGLLSHKKDGNLTMLATEELLNTLFGKKQQTMAEASSVGRFGVAPDIEPSNPKQREEDRKLYNTYTAHIATMREILNQSKAHNGKVNLYSKKEPGVVVKDAIGSAINPAGGGFLNTIVNKLKVYDGDTFDVARGIVDHIGQFVEHGFDDINDSSTVKADVTWKARQNLADFYMTLKPYEDQASNVPADIATNKSNQMSQVFNTLGTAAGMMVPFMKGSNMSRSAISLTEAQQLERLAVAESMTPKIIDIMKKQTWSGNVKETVKAMFNPNLVVKVGANGKPVPISAMYETMADGAINTMAGTLAQNVASGTYDSEETLKRLATNLTFHYLGKTVASAFNKGATVLQGQSKHMIKYGNLATQAELANHLMKQSQYYTYVGNLFANVPQAIASQTVLNKVGIGGYNPKWDDSTNWIQELLAAAFFNAGNIKSSVQMTGGRGKARKQISDIHESAFKHVPQENLQVGEVVKNLDLANTNLMTGIRNVTGIASDQAITLGHVVDYFHSTKTPIPDYLQNLLNTIGKHSGNVELVPALKSELKQGSVMEYDPVNHRILVDNTQLTKDQVGSYLHPESLVQLIAHEGNHALTVNNFKNDPVFRKRTIDWTDKIINNTDLEALLKHYKDDYFREDYNNVMKHRVVNEDGTISLTDAGYLEFLSHMTNPSSAFSKVFAASFKTLYPDSKFDFVKQVKSMFGKTSNQSDYFDAYQKTLLGDQYEAHQENNKVSMVEQETKMQEAIKERDRNRLIAEIQSRPVVETVTEPVVTSPVPKKRGRPKKVQPVVEVPIQTEPVAKTIMSTADMEKQLDVLQSEIKAMPVDDPFRIQKESEFMYLMDDYNISKEMDMLGNDNLPSSASTLKLFNINSTKDEVYALENMTKSYNETAYMLGNSIPIGTPEFIARYNVMHDSEPTARQLIEFIRGETNNIANKESTAYENWLKVENVGSESYDYEAYRDNADPKLEEYDHVDINDDLPKDDTSEFENKYLGAKAVKHGFTSFDSLLDAISGLTFTEVCKKLYKGNLEEHGNKELARDATIMEAVKYRNMEKKDHYYLSISEDGVIESVEKAATDLSNRPLNKYGEKNHRIEGATRQYSKLVNDFLDVSPGSDGEILNKVWNEIMLGRSDGKVVRPLDLIAKTLSANDNIKKSNGISKDVIRDINAVLNLAELGVIIMPQEKGGLARVIPSKRFEQLRTVIDRALIAGQQLGFFNTAFAESHLSDPSMRKMAKQLSKYFDFDGLYEKHLNGKADAEIYNKEMLLKADEKWEKNILPNLVALEKVFYKDLVNYYTDEMGVKKQKPWANENLSDGAKLYGLFMDAYEFALDPTGKTRLNIPVDGKITQGKLSDKYAGMLFDSSPTKYDTESIESMFREFADNDERGVANANAVQNRSQYNLVKENGQYRINAMAYFDGFFDFSPSLSQMFNSKLGMDGGMQGSDGKWQDLIRRLTGSTTSSFKSKGYEVNDYGALILKQALHGAKINEHTQRESPDFYHFNEALKNSNIAFAFNQTSTKNSDALEYKWKRLSANGNEDYYIATNAAGMPIVKTNIDVNGVRTYDTMISKMDMMNDGSLGKNTLLKADEGMVIFATELDFARQQYMNGIIPDLLKTSIALTGDGGLTFLAGAKEQTNFKGSIMPLLSNVFASSDHEIMKSPVGQKAFQALQATQEKVIDYHIKKDFGDITALYSVINNSFDFNSDSYVEPQVTTQGLRSMARATQKLIGFYKGEIAQKREGQYDLISHAAKIRYLESAIIKTEGQPDQFNIAKLKILMGMGADGLLAKPHNNTPMEVTLGAQLLNQSIQDMSKVVTSGMTLTLRPPMQSRAEVYNGIKKQLLREAEQLADIVQSPAEYTAELNALQVKYGKLTDEIINEHIDPVTGLYNKNSNMVTLPESDLANLNAQRKEQGLSELRIGDKIIFGRIPSHGYETTVAGIIGGISESSGTISGSPEIMAKLFGADMDLDGIMVKVPDKLFTKDNFDSVWDFLKEAGLTQHIYGQAAEQLKEAGKTIVSPGITLLEKQHNIITEQRTHKPQDIEGYARTVTKTYTGIDEGLSLRNALSAFMLDAPRINNESYLSLKDIGQVRFSLIDPNLTRWAFQSLGVQSHVDAYDYLPFDKKMMILKSVLDDKNIGPEHINNIIQAIKASTGHNITSDINPNYVTNIGSSLVKAKTSLKNSIDNGVTKQDVNSTGSKMVNALTHFAETTKDLIINKWISKLDAHSSWQGVLAAERIMVDYLKELGTNPQHQTIMDQITFSSSNAPDGLTMNLQEYLAYVTQNIRNHSSTLSALATTRMQAESNQHKVISTIIQTTLEYFEKNLPSKLSKLTPEELVSDKRPITGMGSKVKYVEFNRNLMNLEHQRIIRQIREGQLPLEEGKINNYFLKHLREYNSNKTKETSPLFYDMYDISKLSTFSSKKLKVEIALNIAKVLGQDMSFVKTLMYGKMHNEIPPVANLNSYSDGKYNASMRPIHGSWSNPTFPANRNTFYGDGTDYVNITNQTYIKHYKKQDRKNYKKFELWEYPKPASKILDMVGSSENRIDISMLSRVLKDRGETIEAERLQEEYVNYLDYSGRLDHDVALNNPANDNLQGTFSTLKKNVSEYFYSHPYDEFMKYVHTEATKLGIDMKKGWKLQDETALNILHKEIIAPKLTELVHEMTKDKGIKPEDVEQIAEQMLLNVLPETMQRFEKEQQKSYGSYLGATVAKAALMHSALNSIKKLDNLNNTRWIDKLLRFGYTNSHKVESIINSLSKNQQNYAYDHVIGERIVIRNGVATLSKPVRIMEKSDIATGTNVLGGVFSRNVVKYIWPARRFERIKNAMLANIDNLRMQVNENVNTSTFTNDAALLNGELPPEVLDFLNTIEFESQSDGLVLNERKIHIHHPLAIEESRRALVDEQVQRGNDNNKRNKIADHTYSELDFPDIQGIPKSFELDDTYASSTDAIRYLHGLIDQQFGIRPDEVLTNEEALVRNNQVGSAKKAIAAYINIKKILHPLSQSMLVTKGEIEGLAIRMGYASRNEDGTVDFNTVTIGNKEQARSFQAAIDMIDNAYAEFSDSNPATIVQMTRSLKSGSGDILNAIYRDRLVGQQTEIRNSINTVLNKEGLGLIKNGYMLHRYLKDEAYKMLQENRELDNGSEITKRMVEDKVRDLLKGNTKYEEAFPNLAHDPNKIAGMKKSMNKMSETDIDYVIQTALDKVSHTQINLRKYYDAFTRLQIPGYTAHWDNLTPQQQDVMSKKAGDMVLRGIDDWVKKQNHSSTITDDSDHYRENLTIGVNDFGDYIKIPTNDMLKSVKAESFMLALFPELGRNTDIFDYNIMGIRNKANEVLSGVFSNIETGLRNDFIANGGDANPVAHNETIGALQRILGDKVLFKKDITGKIDEWKKALDLGNKVELKIPHTVSVVHTNSRGVDLHAVGQIIDVFNRPHYYDSKTLEYREHLQKVEKEGIASKIDPVSNMLVINEPTMILMNTEMGTGAHKTFVLNFNNVRNITEGIANKVTQQQYLERYWKNMQPIAQEYSQALQARIIQVTKGVNKGFFTQAETSYRDQPLSLALQNDSGTGPASIISDLDGKVRKNMSLSDKLFRTGTATAEFVIGSYSMSTYLGARGLALAAAAIPMWMSGYHKTAYAMAGKGISIFGGRLFKIYIDNLTSSASGYIQKMPLKTTAQGIARKAILSAKALITPITSVKQGTSPDLNDTGISQSAQANVLQLIKSSTEATDRFQEGMNIQGKALVPVEFQSLLNSPRALALREAADRQANYMENQIETYLKYDFEEYNYHMQGKDYQSMAEINDEVMRISDEQRERFIQSEMEHTPELANYIDQASTLLLNGRKPLSGKKDGQNRLQVIPIGEGLLMYDGQTVQDLSDTAATMADLAIWWLSWKGTIPQSEITSNQRAYGASNRIINNEMSIQKKMQEDYNISIDKQNFDNGEITLHNVDQSNIDPYFYFDIEQLQVEKMIGDYNKLMGHKTLPGLLMSIYGAFKNENKMEQMPFGQGYLKSRRDMFRAMKNEIKAQEEATGDKAYSIAMDNAMIQIASWAIADPMQQMGRQIGVGLTTTAIKKLGGYTARAYVGLFGIGLMSALFDNDKGGVSQSIVGTAYSYPMALSAMLMTYMNMMLLDIGDKDGLRNTKINKSTYKQAMKSDRRAISNAIATFAPGAANSRLAGIPFDMLYVYGKILWDRMHGASSVQNKLNDEAASEAWTKVVLDAAAFGIPMGSAGTDIYESAKKAKKDK